MTALFQRIRRIVWPLPSDEPTSYSISINQIPPHTLPDKVNPHQVDITMPHIVRFGDGTYGVRMILVERKPNRPAISIPQFYNAGVWQTERVSFSDLNHVHKIMDSLHAEQDQKKVERLKGKVVEIIPHAPLRAVAQSQVETVLSDGSIITVDHVQLNDHPIP